MTAEQTFKVTELIRRNIKIEKDAEKIVSEIENIVEDKFSSRADTLATKQDISGVRLEIANLRTEISDRINNASLKVIGTIVIVGLIQVILKHYNLF